MWTGLPHVLNLINSLIGVSILSMPYCFHKCGILLSGVLLCIVAYLSQKTSHFLMKAAHSSKKKSYELTVFSLFGTHGKILVELSIIGMLMGSLIAFFVIVGELLPELILYFIPALTFLDLRLPCLIFSAFGMILPLSLMKDLSKLSSLSGISIFLYVLFTVHIMLLSRPALHSAETWKSLYWWRSAGIFECIPIFALAFACHTQLFVIYHNMLDPMVKQMDFIVGRSIGISAAIYGITGFFGYIGFAHYGDQLPGNILSVYPLNSFSQIMKISFLFSMLLSYPLIIIPCRTSIYSLIYSHTVVGTDPASELTASMPEREFKYITISIVTITFLISVFIPNVELILGLNGSITGSLLCFIFPSALFLKVKPQKRLSLANVTLIFGLLILFISTALTLQESQENSLKNDYSSFKIAKKSDQLSSAKSTLTTSTFNAMETLKAIYNKSQLVIPEKMKAQG